MTAVVAIDGPGGSGKSTIAAALAVRLGVPHVDTGAYYRAAALAVLRAGVDPDDQGAVTATVTRATIERRDGRTLLDGQDVEDVIRGADVTAVVSTVSAQPGVRAALLGRQRAAVTAQGAVVEGRDAGTAVVPDAGLKVWLTASAEERAGRRATQVGETGAAAIAQQAAALRVRDDADRPQMERAADAVVVDTTGRDVTAVVDDLAARIPAATTGDGSVPS